MHSSPQAPYTCSTNIAVSRALLRTFCRRVGKSIRAWHDSAKRCSKAVQQHVWLDWAHSGVPHTVPCSARELSSMALLSPKSASFSCCCVCHRAVSAAAALPPPLAGAVTAAASAALEALSVVDWLLPDCRVSALLLQHAPQTAQSVRMRQYDWPTRCWPSVARNAVHGNRATMVSSDSIVVQQMRQTAARNKAKKPPEQHVVQLDVAGGDAEAVAVVHRGDELLEQRPRPCLWQWPTLQQLRRIYAQLRKAGQHQHCNPLLGCKHALQCQQMPALRSPHSWHAVRMLLIWHESNPQLADTACQADHFTPRWSRAADVTALTSFSMWRSTASDMSPPSAYSITNAKWFLWAAPNVK